MRICDLCGGTEGGVSSCVVDLGVYEFSKPKGLTDYSLRRIEVDKERHYDLCVPCRKALWAGWEQVLQARREELSRVPTSPPAPAAAG